MRTLPLLTASLLLSGAALAQVPYSIDIDPAQSNSSWWANTSMGNVVGAPTLDFQFDGVIDVQLGNASAPFGTGEFVGGDAFTIPSTLAGKIPNPIPFTPPLARIEMRGLHAGVQSGSFPITAGTGAFSTTVVMDMIAGEIFVDPWIGTPTTTPIAGMVSDPFTISGTFTESGGNVVMDCPLNPVFPLTGSISGNFGVNGDLVGSAPVQVFNMSLSATQMVSGQMATFDVAGAYPNADTWLAYSVSGPGSTPIGALGITLDLNAPAVAAGPNSTDGNGDLTWGLMIPSAAGVSVWMQACQAGLTSNVINQVIQ